MTTETFGQRLKRLREAKGWTQETLSQCIPGACASTIDYFEKKDSEEPSGLFFLSALRLLSKNLCVTMDYLYTGVEPKPDDWANTPGKRIRLRRDELGWTMDMIVDKSNLSEDTIKDIETDVLESSVKNAARFLSNTLGVTPEWILTGKEPKFPPKAIQHPLYKEFSTSYWYGEGETMDVNFRVRCNKADRERIVEALRFGKAIE